MPIGERPLLVNSPTTNNRPCVPNWCGLRQARSEVLGFWGKNTVLSSHSAGFRGGQGPPPKRGPTMLMCLAICTTCAFHLVIFISEKSLFEDAIKLSVVQTAVFHLNIVWYCDETTITLIVFLKVGQVPESSAAFPKVGSTEP